MGGRCDFLNQALPRYYSAWMLTNMEDICCCSVRCGNVWTGGKQWRIFCIIYWQLRI